MLEKCEASKSSRRGPISRRDGSLAGSAYPRYHTLPGYHTAQMDATWVVYSSVAAATATAAAAVLTERPTAVLTARWSFGLYALNCALLFARWCYEYAHRPANTKAGAAPAPARAAAPPSAAAPSSRSGSAAVLKSGRGPGAPKPKPRQRKKRAASGQTAAPGTATAPQPAPGAATAPQPAPAAPAAAAAAAAAPALPPALEPSSDLERMVGMGFDATDAGMALQQTVSLDAAVDLLLSCGPGEEAPAPASSPVAEAEAVSPPCATANTTTAFSCGEAEEAHAVAQARSQGNELRKLLIIKSSSAERLADSKGIGISWESISSDGRNTPTPSSCSSESSRPDTVDTDGHSGGTPPRRDAFMWTKKPADKKLLSAASPKVKNRSKRSAGRKKGNAKAQGAADGENEVVPLVLQVAQLHGHDLPPQTEPGAALMYQIEFYFSAQNMPYDVFLLQNMDEHWNVPLRLLLGFPRIKRLSGVADVVIAALRHSQLVVVDTDSFEEPVVRPILSHGAAMTQQESALAAAFVAEDFAAR